MNSNFLRCESAIGARLPFVLSLNFFIFSLILWLDEKLKFVYSAFATGCLIDLLLVVKQVVVYELKVHFNRFNQFHFQLLHVSYNLLI